MDQNVRSTLMILAGALGIIFIGIYDLLMERGYVTFGIFSALALLVCVGLTTGGIILKTRNK
jgi:hypothetical protein